MNFALFKHLKTKIMSGLAALSGLVAIVTFSGLAKAAGNMRTEE